MHLIALAVLSVMPCWTIYDRALAHSAAAPHPPYVSYNERTSIWLDGEALVQSDAQIDYRDDGTARVSDDRFARLPFVTRALQPGPPEIGPYDGRRTMFLPVPSAGGTIATVRANGNVTCTLEGMKRRGYRDAYHLVFRGAQSDRAHLDEMWVDAGDFTIWRFVVTAPVPVTDEAGATIPLTQFDVELAYEGPYLLVRRAMFSYTERIYTQQARYSGEYLFANYSFPRSLPPSYFALGKKQPQ